MKHAFRTLLTAAFFLVVPLASQAADVSPGGPVRVGAGIGWSTAAVDGDTIVGQGPSFLLDVNFKVTSSLLLGIEGTYTLQPWTKEDSDYAYDDDASYSRGNTGIQRLSLLGVDGKASWYFSRIFYLQGGLGFTALQYKWDWGDGKDPETGSEYGWNGLLAIGLEAPVARIFRIGAQARFSGGYILTEPDLYGFTVVSLNLMLSFL